MNRVHLLLLTTFLVSTSLSAERPVNETRVVDTDARIEIDVVSGSIRVTGWERSEVSITGTLGDDVEALEITGSGGMLSIGLDVPGGWRWGARDIDVHLDISIPRQARLRVETVSADIDLEELEGSVELGSVSGQIKLAGRPKQAEIESVSGDIRVAGERTSISVETVSGQIDLQGVADRLEAASVSGDIGIRASQVDRATFESVSGSIAFTGSLANTARLDVETHSGNVTLELPAETSATFDVESFSGNIENEFGFEAERTGDYTPSKRLRFTLGTGGSRVEVESFSGNIRLKKGAAATS